MPTSGIRIVAEKNLGSFLSSAKATINNSAVVTYSGGLSPSTSPPPAYTQAELDILGAPVTLDNVMILENIQPQQEAASLDSKSSRKTFVNLDSKAWHGGFSTIVSPTTDSAAAAAGSNTTAAAATTETPVFAELQTNNMIRSGRGRGGGGRRAARDIKQEQLSPEEEQRLRLRRERNKEAAARCRKRRVDQTEALQAQVDEHEEKKRLLQEEIISLQSQREDLQFLLDAHRQVCSLNLQPSAAVVSNAAATILNIPAAPVDMRTSSPMLSSGGGSLNYSNHMTAAGPRSVAAATSLPKVIVKCEETASFDYHPPSLVEDDDSGLSERHLTHEEALEMPRSEPDPLQLPPAVTTAPTRPATLSLSIKPQCLRSIEGVPIETPTNVFSSLNFDSLMDGRTGLTPTNVLTPVSITMSLQTPGSQLQTPCSVTTPTCGSQQRTNQLKSPTSKPNLVSL